LSENKSLKRVRPYQNLAWSPKSSEQTLDEVVD
jgi:hypothetical protein